MSDNDFEAMLAAAGMGNKKEIPEDYRCGYTAVVGRPNVGKSTLINAIVGEKVSITSKKPQTTRDRVLGVATDDDAQIVFVDTPGFQSKHTSQLLKHMNRTVRTALADVEAVLFVIDAAGWKSDDELVLKLLDREAKNVILVLNKIDLVKDKERLLPLMAESMQKFPFAAIVPVSAEKGKMLDDLKGEIKELLPVSPPFFDADLYTDKSPRFIAAETIREKAFRLLRSKLYDLELEKKQNAEAAERRSQIGTGDRSEKIRTYNFPQGRVTDHRIKLTLHKLDTILNGDLDEVIDSLIAADQSAKLANMNE